MNKKTFTELFSEPYTVKVHSTFRHVVNLEGRAGLISVVTSEIGRMHSYIVIPDSLNHDFIYMGISTGDEGFIQSTGMHIDTKLSIDFTGTAFWEGPLDKGFKWNPHELEEDNLSALSAALSIYAAAESAYRKIYEKKDKPFEEAAERLKLCNDYDAIFSSVRDLIGLGPGLTPSGDDFITGFAAAVISCSEKVDMKGYLEDSIYKNLKRTGYISGNMLLNAVKGFFHEYIQDLIYAAALKTPEDVMDSTKRLIKIGATSGSDIAAGIFTGFKIMQEYFSGKAR